MSKRRQRNGFTLIELLVVIAIIGILIALLVPAVQKVREAAARTECANNIKQLAIGCHNYHDVNKKLPPAVLMQSGVNETAGNGNFGPNWIILILPYIEQGPLYSTISTSVDSYMATGNNGWRSARTTRIKMLECPADLGHQNPWNGTGGTDWARGNYACNAGGLHQPTAPAGTDGLGWRSSRDGKSPVYGSASSFGGGPVPDGTTCGGVMTINYGMKLSQLSNMDGTSATIMLNEVRVGAHLSPGDPRGTWAVGMPGASVTCAGWTWDCTNPNDRNSDSDDCEGAINDPAGGMGAWQPCPFQQATARSRHTAGVNAAFSDGSVRYISNGVSQMVWWGLNCRDDGISVGEVP